MVPPVVVTILAFFHIASAMAWLGGGTLLTFVITPSLRRVSPAAGLEFLTKIGPRASLFGVGAATSTIIFGVALFLSIPDLGVTIYVGLALGLAAYLIGILATAPAFMKAFRLAKDLMASNQSGPPPADLVAAMRRGGVSSVVSLVLLVITLVFMVASGYPF